MPPSTAERCLSRPLQISASRSISAPPSARVSFEPSRRQEFSTTQRNDASLSRIEFRKWLYSNGKNFKRPIPGETNYLNAYDRYGNLQRARRKEDRGDERNTSQAKQRSTESAVDVDASAADDTMIDEELVSAPPNNTDRPQPRKESAADLQPFPLNPHFRSQPVLSSELRDEIYRRVVDQGQTLREVSVALNVEMVRVGAVVRLKTVEQNWIREGKPLATKYQDAILDMLPKTPFKPATPGVPRHETINNLPIHSATGPQLFHPVPESQDFTRTDASRVFSNTLLPPDERIPHPELIESAKDKFRRGLRDSQVKTLQKERIEKMESERRERRERAAMREEKSTRVVHATRWDARIRDVDIEAGIGSTGRGHKAIGWRYGFPHEDRKREKAKIPASVDA